MIFIITGTQEPFDRMVKVVDEIAANYKDKTFIAQVSKSTLNTSNLKTFNFIPPLEFNKYFEQAELIVSHAGMGTILSALERNKPIVVMPRYAKYGEHRNDHQEATCKVFDKLGYVNVAYDESELKDILTRFLEEGASSLHKIGKFASESLISSINQYVEQQI